MCTGLSPRVRGNRFQRGQAGDDHRSIPACAGEPESRSSSGSWVTVYPRVCGGTTRCAGSVPNRCGLSPRVRGNLKGFDDDAVFNGSIPACAGEPRSVSAWEWDGEVYPRVCGGTAVGVGVGMGWGGLSPRVRGNRRGTVMPDRNIGSIPACAGEPAPFRSEICLTAVYPRVCGGTAD